MVCLYTNFMETFCSLKLLWASYTSIALELN